MRISYLFNTSTPSSSPGSIQVVNTCDAIASYGHKIVLITPNTGKNISLKKFYGIQNKIKLVKIKWFKEFPLGMSYYLYSAASILNGLFLKTEIFITRNFFTLFILNLLKKKVIIEVHHDLENEGRLVKFLYRNFDIFDNQNIIKIIAITNSVKSYLIHNFKIDKKKIEIIPSASSLKFKFKKLKKKYRYNIGYFGSLDKSKGSNFIISLSKKDKKNKYYIYGGKPEEVQKLKKNISNNLKINPSIPYSKIKSYLSKMDILLIPSNTKKLRSLGGVGNIAKFTSPLKLFDYLASGKLILASNLKVFREILKDEKNCIIVNKMDENNWKNKINKIKFKLSKVNKIKKNAYNLSKEYTYLKRAKKILNLNNSC